ncbi:hypothetical protein ATCC90586_004988 [Pythium insidiosum]|nr:hypothetical protein ATCC90586_004988 [Pythium insidiosum]
MSAQAVEALTSVDQTLTAVEEHLQVFKNSSIEEFLAELAPVEKAKVQVSLAYSINALLYVYLKTQGVSSKDIRQTHVKQELDRVKGFIKKIKDTEELAKGPTLKLDKEASQRFINNALSGDQVYVDAKKARDAEAAPEASATPSKKQPRSSETNAKNSSDKKSKRRRKQ